MVKSNVSFNFQISPEEVTEALNSLNQIGKYDGWHSIEGVDEAGKVCVKGDVQVFLRTR